MAKSTTKASGAKKPSKARGKAAKASPAKRKAAKKKVAAKKRTATKSLAALKQTARKRTAIKRPAALGRPRVPGTANLDQMFLKDYEARQVFAFLRVQTLKELEEHDPDEIIEQLMGPMLRTVERIRKALAVNNRYLSGDQKFAVQFKKLIR